MSRIRTIKPEFWTNEQVVECSMTARLLFIGLWNFCDDQGVHPYSLNTVKMEIFPGDNIALKEIESLLNELIKNNLINTYHIENKRYLIIMGWHHQKVDRPNPKYPLPDKFDEHSTNKQQLLDEQSPPEGKGRESNGINIKAAEQEPFRLPSKDEIENGSKAMTLESIDRVAEEIYRAEKWKDVHACKNKLLKESKNERAILHALVRIHLKDPPPKDPWAYCVQIMKQEDGNFNAKDYGKNQGRSA